MTGIAIYGTGVAAKRYTTGPWGEAAADTGAVTRLRMAGQVYDASAGLYYMGARLYDPDLGRFISEDPIGIAGGLNIYAYANNDPINAMDPTGTDPKCRAGVGGAVPGGAREPVACDLDPIIIGSKKPEFSPDQGSCTFLINCWGPQNQAYDMERLLDAEWHPAPGSGPERAGCSDGWAMIACMLGVPAIHAIEINAIEGRGAEAGLEMFVEMEDAADALESAEAVRRGFSVVVRGFTAVVRAGSAIISAPLIVCVTCNMYQPGHRYYGTQTGA